MTKIDRNLTITVKKKTSRLAALWTDELSKAASADPGARVNILKICEASELKWLAKKVTSCLTLSERFAALASTTESKEVDEEIARGGKQQCRTVDIRPRSGQTAKETPVTVADDGEQLVDAEWLHTWSKWSPSQEDPDVNNNEPRGLIPPGKLAEVAKEQLNFYKRLAKSPKKSKGIDYEKLAKVAQEQRTLYKKLHSVKEKKEKKKSRWHHNDVPSKKTAKSPYKKQKKKISPIRAPVDVPIAPSKSNDDCPKMEDAKTYGEYRRALAKWKEKFPNKKPSDLSTKTGNLNKTCNQTSGTKQTKRQETRLNKTPVKEVDCGFGEKHTESVTREKGPEKTTCHVEKIDDVALAAQQSDTDLMDKLKPEEMDIDLDINGGGDHIEQGDACSVQGKATTDPGAAGDSVPDSKPQSGNIATSERECDSKEIRPLMCLRSPETFLYPPTGVPNLPLGVPNFLPGVPNFPPGVSNFPPGVPNFPSGVPNLPGGVPNFHPGVPNFRRGVPNFPPGVPNLRPGVPNFHPGVPHLLPHIAPMAPNIPPVVPNIPPVVSSLLSGNPESYPWIPPPPLPVPQNGTPAFPISPFKPTEPVKVPVHVTDQGDVPYNHTDTAVLQPASGDVPYDPADTAVLQPDSPGSSPHNTSNVTNAEESAEDLKDLISMLIENVKAGFGQETVSQEPCPEKTSNRKDLPVVSKTEVIVADTIEPRRMSQRDIPKPPRSEKKTRPDTAGKFHGRTLLMGHDVPARFIPLEPLFRSYPLRKSGKPEEIPFDPRPVYYTANRRHKRKVKENAMKELLVAQRDTENTDFNPAVFEFTDEPDDNMDFRSLICKPVQNVKSQVKSKVPEPKRFFGTELSSFHNPKVKKPKPSVSLNAEFSAGNVHGERFKSSSDEDFALDGLKAVEDDHSRKKFAGARSDQNSSVDSKVGAGKEAGMSQVLQDKISSLLKNCRDESDGTVTPNDEPSDRTSTEASSVNDLENLLETSSILHMQTSEIHSIMEKTDSGKVAQDEEIDNLESIVNGRGDEEEKRSDTRITQDVRKVIATNACNDEDEVRVIKIEGPSIKKIGIVKGIQKRAPTPEVQPQERHFSVRTKPRSRSRNNSLSSAGSNRSHSVEHLSPPRQHKRSHHKSGNRHHHHHHNHHRHHSSHKSREKQRSSTQRSSTLDSVHVKAEDELFEAMFFPDKEEFGPRLSRSSSDNRRSRSRSPPISREITRNGPPQFKRELERSRSPPESKIPLKRSRSPPESRRPIKRERSPVEFPRDTQTSKSPLETRRIFINRGRSPPEARRGAKRSRSPPESRRGSRPGSPASYRSRSSTPCSTYSGLTIDRPPPRASNYSSSSHVSVYEHEKPTKSTKNQTSHKYSHRERSRSPSGEARRKRRRTNDSWSRERPRGYDLAEVLVPPARTLEHYDDVTYLSEPSKQVPYSKTGDRKDDLDHRDIKVTRHYSGDCQQRKANVSTDTKKRSRKTSAAGGKADREWGRAQTWRDLDRAHDTFY